MVLKLFLYCRVYWRVPASLEPTTQKDKLYDVEYDTDDKAIQCGPKVKI